MGAVPIAVAHRGDPFAERENTLGAFAAAVRAGADMVEIDLRRSRDGEIVVLHDATLARLWGLERAVVDLDGAELAAIGHGDVRIPTLREVLLTVEVPLMVDFTSRTVVEGAVEAVRGHDAMDRSLFVTGNVEALRILRALAPEARIGVTWVEPGPPPETILEELRAEYWNPMFSLITPEHVDVVHALGRKVSTWTVDEPGDMARVTHAGVDAIVSNRIADLRRFVDRAISDAPAALSGFSSRASGRGPGPQ
jgi:glycerophosphoryl diester phosphodiesterase